MNVLSDTTAGDGVAVGEEGGEQGMDACCLAEENVEDDVDDGQTVSMI